MDNNNNNNNNNNNSNSNNNNNNYYKDESTSILFAKRLAQIVVPKSIITVFSTIFSAVIMHLLFILH